MKFAAVARLGLLTMNAAPAARTLHRDVDQLVARLRGLLAQQDEQLAVTARITPLSDRGLGEPRDAQLATFDHRGVAFEHPLPLAARRAMVSLESPELGRVTAEVDLSWCRYREGGRYTSGGRFVQVWDDQESPGQTATPSWSAQSPRVR